MGSQPILGSQLILSLFFLPFYKPPPHFFFSFWLLLPFVFMSGFHPLFSWFGTEPGSKLPMCYVVRVPSLHLFPSSNLGVIYSWNFSSPHEWFFGGVILLSFVWHITAPSYQGNEGSYKPLPWHVLGLQIAVLCELSVL